MICMPDFVFLPAELPKYQYLTDTIYLSNI